MHPFLSQQQSRDNGCVQAAGLCRPFGQQEGNREQLPPTATAMQSFAMVSCAQLPVQPKDHCRRAVIAGQGQGNWEGKCQREECRMREYVCMGQGKKEMLAKHNKTGTR